MGTAISGILGAFGLSASAGLNAYIPLLIVSLLAKFTDLIKLSDRGTRSPVGGQLACWFWSWWKP